eukprot:CAMPEP_0117538766 /NCGR_PEP_ID=MMETSP0784-20121206/42646_1 /TAXON_ID=39447 /ORGANISM="" /LENGTH=159 /DNA_ID=CAMNT_0005335387 /DNA_START=115 /DNA_END=594 /DNA_ORIENTATION=+
MMAEVGAVRPLGKFDPLGFSKTDKATYDKYRECELKHGRIAMLATFGILTQEKFHPFYDGKLSSNPLAAFTETPPLAFVQIVIFCGILEYQFAAIAKGENYTAGDYYGINARISEKDTEAWVGFQNRELNNGRAAMFGILGMLAHAAITGKGPLELMGF